MKRLLALQSWDMVLITSAAMFMAQLDGAVLVVALPDIARDFGRPVVSLSLAVSIYVTMIVAVLPASGWAADRFGAKRVFLSAIVGFAAFSLCCALSETFWTFILARALQGASAALIVPVGRLILLRQTSKEELVDAMAITAMPMLIAPTFGPSLGGFIVDYARWEYIFLLNLPVSALLFLVACIRIPRMEADPRLPLDVRGIVLLGGGLIAMLTGLDRLVGGLAAPLPWSLIATGMLLFLAAIHHIRRHPGAVVETAAMHSPAFRTAAIGAGAFSRLPPRALIFALPLMFQVGFGLSPFVAGLLLIALNGGDLITKPWIKPLFDRLGYRHTVIGASIAGLAAIAVFIAATPGQWLLPLLTVALFVAGMARSLVFTGISTLSYATLGPSTMTSGNVLANISMQLFNALSISITAVILSLFARAGGYTEPSIDQYRLTLAAIAGIGIVSTLFLYHRLPHDLREVHPKDATA